MTTTDREAPDAVPVFRDIRPTSRHEKTFFLKYALAITIEIAVAFWLLSFAKGEFAWTAWIAYLILASAALATLMALSWCWLWFVERGMGWYVAAILSLAGAIIDLWWHLH